MTETTKIILADDHALTRDGLKTAIEKNNNEVVAEAEDFDSLKDCMRDNKAQLIISDCKMSGVGPVSFLYYAKKTHPEIKVVYLSGLNSGALFGQLLAIGADGLVSKQDSTKEVILAIDEVMSGKLYVSPSVKLKIDAADKVLTKREFQVLELIAQGKSSNEIAEILCRSYGTINTHRVSIMRKLDVHNVVGIIHFCRDNEFFES